MKEGERSEHPLIFANVRCNVDDSDFSSNNLTSHYNRISADTTGTRVAMVIVKKSWLIMLLIRTLLPVSSDPFVSKKIGGFWTVIPRGGSTSDYRSNLQLVLSQVLLKASTAISHLNEKIAVKGQVVSDLGLQADTICNRALQDFSNLAPVATPEDDAAEYDRCLAQLESALDSPLHVLYLKQLSLFRSKALEEFRSSTASSGGVPSYEAIVAADSTFVSAAEESSRPGWDYSSERSYLQAILNDIAVSGHQVNQVKINGAQQQQTAMQFLQTQQQMIQQLQMQLYGQSSPWNIGVAYRIPDTNFNLQGTYQQGRTNIQLSCVPDEYAPFLGPNGFTNGVGPGNLGLSLNLII